MQIVAYNHGLSSIGFARDGKLFATGSTQGDAMLWDLASRTPIANLQGHLLGVHAVAFSPDGRRVATASGGREAVKLWDVATRQEVATLAGQGSVFQTVQFSSDGNTLMAINLLGTLHLWRAASFVEIDAMEKRAASMEEGVERK
jgi:WD40 repeat protein